MARRFRLSAVLRLRRAAEDAAKRSIGEARTRVATAEADRLRAIASIRDAATEMTAMAAGRQIAAIGELLGALERELTTATMRVRAANEGVTAAAEAYAVAKREREAIERTVDRFMADEQRARNRRADAIAAESAAVRDARRRLGLDGAGS